MYKKYILAVLVCLAAGIFSVHAQAPGRRLDTTMKLGKAGYRIICSNKNADKNVMSVRPIGFDKNIGEFNLDLKGRVPRAEVDDINRDGFPDLLLYIVGNDSLNKVTVVGIASEKNETVVGISMPDIYDDPKLRVGYKGNDSFFLMEGYLIRRFPVVPTEGGTAAAAGNLIRQIQYTVVPEERGGYKFKVVRSYDFPK